MSRSPPRVHDNVEIEEDPRFQAREWRVQRVAWIVFALIIAAAIIGVFGHGPLSKASASGAGLRMDYQRIARWRNPHTLTIHLTAGDSSAKPIIWISREYLQGVEIERITPQPVSERAGPGRIEFEFASAAGGGGATTAASPSAGESRTITFSLVPIARGTLSGAIGLNDGAAIEFSQFIMP